MGGGIDNEDYLRGLQVMDKTLLEGFRAYERGDHRLAATKHLEAFQATKDRWDHMRATMLNGHKTILLEEYFEPSLERDIAPLKAIMNDKKELKYYRMEAACTLGVLLDDGKGNREEAADYIREALDLAEKIPKREKKHKVMGSVVTPDGNQSDYGLRCIEELIPITVLNCKNAINLLTSSSFFEKAPPTNPTRLLRSDGTPMPQKKSMTWVPLETALGQEGFLTREEVDRLIQVGGEKCDCCGKSRTELGQTLLDVCYQCKKAYYCSRECQVKQWKAGHKQCCRKPGEFRPGDYIRLRGLQSKPEMNGTLVQVVKADSKANGRWGVKRPNESKPFSVSSEKMEQLRPLK